MGSGNEKKDGSNSRGINVIRQRLQLRKDGGLAEREHGVFGVWVKLHDHVLDLELGGNEWPWRGDARVVAREYLVSPQKLITMPVLEMTPGVYKLVDAMAPHMVCEGLCFVPVERGSERQEAHDLWNECQWRPFL